MSVVSSLFSFSEQAVFLLRCLFVLIVIFVLNSFFSHVPFNKYFRYDVCRGENGELHVGVRLRQQTYVPSSVISSHSMHLGVLATTWHNTGTMAMVASSPCRNHDLGEFLVPLIQ